MVKEPYRQAQGLDFLAQNQAIANMINNLFGIPGTKPRARITNEVGIQAADRLTCFDICSDIL